MPAATMNTGISEADRAKIVEGLKRVLADTYTLYLKTHNYHWNVTGPMFDTLHRMFMDQYNELWTAVDEIAERIRALGHYAPGGYKAFAELTRIEEDADVPRGHADDHQSGRCTGKHHSHSARNLSKRRSQQRRSDRRPADAAPAYP